MQGMFRANGGCGYLKKPDLLQKVGPDGKVFDPKANLPVKTTLKVGVYYSNFFLVLLAIFGCYLMLQNPNRLKYTWGKGGAWISVTPTSIYILHQTSIQGYSEFSIFIFLFGLK